MFVSEVSNDVSCDEIQYGRAHVIEAQYILEVKSQVILQILPLFLDK